MGIDSLIAKNLVCYGESPRTILLTPKGLESTPWPRPKANADAHQELFEMITSKNSASLDVLKFVWDELTKGHKKNFYSLVQTTGTMGGAWTRKRDYQGLEKMVQLLSNLGLVIWDNGSVQLTDLAFPHGRGMA